MRLRGPPRRRDAGFESNNRFNTPYPERLFSSDASLFFPGQESADRAARCALPRNFRRLLNSSAPIGMNLAQIWKCSVRLPLSRPAETESRRGARISAAKLSGSVRNQSPLERTRFPSVFLIPLLIHPKRIARKRVLRRPGGLPVGRQASATKGAKRKLVWDPPTYTSTCPLPPSRPPFTGRR